MSFLFIQNFFKVILFDAHFALCEMFILLNFIFMNFSFIHAAVGNVKSITPVCHVVCTLANGCNQFKPCFSICNSHSFTAAGGFMHTIWV
uniref:Uncharacterized protein n=1 Tax=Arundo donax TaxID=35708 RepID=A0A0A8Y950_ARUDO